MKGDPRVVAALDDYLATELGGHSQYLVHARMCAHWGYRRLAHHRAEHARDELEHAGELVERILFLGGAPKVERSGEVRIGQSVAEQLAVDHALVSGAVARLEKSIALAAEVGDGGSRAMLERFLVSEEHLLRWLEEQLSLIRQVSEQRYLAEQIRE